MLFLQNIGWTTLAQTAASLAAFVYTLIAARTLGVASYGLFQAVMAVYGLFAIIHLPFSFGSLHCAGRASDHNRPRVQGALFTLSLITAALTTVIFICLSSAAAPVLKTNDLTVWFACAALVASTTLLTQFYGVLQAERRFPLFAAAKITEVTLLLILGTGLLRAGWGPAGAVLGYTLAMTCVLFYFILRFRPSFVSWPEAKTLLASELRPLQKMAFVLAFLLVLENAPAIWARFVLDSTHSGYFGALYNLRSAVWPFALAITLTFYSHLLAGEPAKPLLNKALILIAALAAGFETTALFFSDPLVRLLYGSAFAPAAPHLALYGLSLSLQMAAMLLLFYRLGKNQLRAAPLFFALAVFLAGLYWGERSITGIWIAQAAGAGTCLASLVLKLPFGRRA